MDLGKQDLGEAKSFPSASSCFGVNPFLQRPNHEIWLHDLHGKSAGLNAERGNPESGNTQRWHDGVLQCP